MAAFSYILRGLMRHEQDWLVEVADARRNLANVFRISLLALLPCAPGMCK
jgi:hypothetical protein